jgi:hypothetical protein
MYARFSFFQQNKWERSEFKNTTQTHFVISLKGSFTSPLITLFYLCSSLSIYPRPHHPSLPHFLNIGGFNPLISPVHQHKHAVSPQLLSLTLKIMLFFSFSATRHEGGLMLWVIIRTMIMLPVRHF